MTFLSSIFGFSQKRAGMSSIFYPRDDRDAVRHDANIPVSIQLRGTPALTGSVINISIGGAAIQIHNWNNVALTQWFSLLEQGSELQLTGLIEMPMTSWVVLFDYDILRIHFASDDVLRRQLRVVIGMLAAP